MVAANERTALTLGLSGGQAHDMPAGRALLAARDKPPTSLPLLMDRGYEGDETPATRIRPRLYARRPAKGQPHRALVL